MLLLGMSKPHQNSLLSQFDTVSQTEIFAQNEPIIPNLHDYDLVIINSSAGKDSLVSIWQLCQMADKQGYSRSKMIVSHQDLKSMEWKETKELAKEQADLFGLKIEYSTRRDKDGKEDDLLTYAENRGKWPSNKQRWCTSDFKRGPGARVVTRLTKDLGKCKILHVFGFRREESPSRKKKPTTAINKNLTTKRRTVIDYLPVHEWSTKHVWQVIKSNNLPYHYAYDLGMPRLSCVFCIFSPFNALVIAGKSNPELLDKYVEVEEKIGHTFKAKESLKQVKQAIADGYQPKTVENWIM